MTDEHGKWCLGTRNNHVTPFGAVLLVLFTALLIWLFTAGPQNVGQKLQKAGQKTEGRPAAASAPR